jgi:flavodoxin
MTFSKLQTRSNWSVREGTAKEVAPQLKDKESEVLAIIVEREDPLVHAKFQALKNLIRVIDALVEDRAQRKWKDVIEVLTPDVPLSQNKLVEAKMFAEAARAVLESKEFVRAQDIAKVAHFSRKNPSSQPNRWKRAGYIFAVSYKGADLYPSYALDWKQGAKPLPVMSKIVKLFGDKDDWQKAFWFGSVNSYLKNKMPKDLLKSHPEEVLKAAELEALGVQHG